MKNIKSGRKREFFFSKVFSTFEFWTKKMSKNENLKKILGNLHPHCIMKNYGKGIKKKVSTLLP
jgi:hypothetical protein